MNKFHVLIASLILGLAAIFGVAAATKTTGLGAAATHAQTGKVSQSTIAARQHKLDRVQIALRRALADKPPALPRVPTVPPAPRVSAAPMVQRTVYTRPAPVVVIRHSGSHEREHEQEHGGGDD